MSFIWIRLHYIIYYVFILFCIVTWLCYASKQEATVYTCFHNFLSDIVGETVGRSWKWCSIRIFVEKKKDEKKAEPILNDRSNTELTFDFCYLLTVSFLKTGLCRRYLLWWDRPNRRFIWRISLKLNAYAVALKIVVLVIHVFQRLFVKPSFEKLFFRILLWFRFLCRVVLKHSIWCLWKVDG